VADDLNGSGYRELAMLGRHRVSGALRIQLRDSNTGELLLNIDLPNQGWGKGQV